MLAKCAFRTAMFLAAEKKRRCAETRFGCCPDGKTVAPAADYSGCPSKQTLMMR